MSIRACVIHFWLTSALSPTVAFARAAKPQGYPSTISVILNHMSNIEAMIHR